MKQIELARGILEVVRPGEAIDLENVSEFIDCFEIYNNIFYTARLGIEDLEELGDLKETRTKTLELLNTLENKTGTVKEVLQETYNKDIDSNTAEQIGACLYCLYNQKLSTFVC